MSADMSAPATAAATHWDSAYSRKGAEKVGWFEPTPTRSIEIIVGLLGSAAGKLESASVIDVGGGASSLVDRLLELGVRHVAVLDLSDVGLELSRQRLGPEGSSARVSWIVGDVTAYRPQCERGYTVWHDRAVFHFLMDEQQQRAYRDSVLASVALEGFVIVATFALDGGPTECSRLPIRRHDVESITRIFDAERFTLLSHMPHEHVTPAGETQKFTYFVLARKS